MCCHIKPDNCAIFTETAPLDRFSHRVAMSFCLFVCLSVCLHHRVQSFSRPLIGPEVTWSDLGSWRYWPAISEYEEKNSPKWQRLLKNKAISLAFDKNNFTKYQLYQNLFYLGIFFFDPLNHIRRLRYI